MSTEELWEDMRAEAHINTENDQLLKKSLCWSEQDDWSWGHVLTSTEELWEDMRVKAHVNAKYS